MRVGLSGHQTMPDVAYEFAGTAIEDYLKVHANVIGICSLASGADQLFANKILLSGHRLHAVIPCVRYEDTFEKDDLHEYQRLLDSASDVEILNFPQPSEEAFWAAGKRVAELCDELIAIWDGEPSDGLGGTADIVQYAKSLGKKVLVFWPDGVRR